MAAAIGLHLAIGVLLSRFVGVAEPPAPSSDPGIQFEFSPPSPPQEPPPDTPRHPEITPAAETPAPPSAEPVPQPAPMLPIPLPEPLPPARPPSARKPRPIVRTQPAMPSPPVAPGPNPARAEPQAPIPAAWQQSLASFLTAHKIYPDEARRSGNEGVVVLRFTTDRSGHVSQVILVRSAGSALLDAAAESMIRTATLPPFSDGMPQETVTVTVQIRYALTN